MLATKLTNKSRNISDFSHFLGLGRDNSTLYRTWASIYLTFAYLCLYSFMFSQGGLFVLVVSCVDINEKVNKVQIDTFRLLYIVIESFNNTFYLVLPFLLLSLYFSNFCFSQHRCPEEE